MGGTFFNLPSTGREIWENIQLYKFWNSSWSTKLVGETESECWYAPQFGRLIKWSVTGDTVSEGYWEDAGAWKGEAGQDGQTYYVHTAFANAVNDGEEGYNVMVLEYGEYKNVVIKRTDSGVPGKYFGIYTDTIEEDENNLSVKWVWSR